jgi:hypothetical protein
MERKCIVGERKDFENIGKSNKQEHVFTCIFFFSVSVRVISNVTFATAPVNFWVESKYEMMAAFTEVSCFDLRLNFATDTS